MLATGKAIYGEENQATAYNKMGLKVKNLMAVQSELQRAQRSYCEVARGGNTGVIASLRLRFEEEPGSGG